MKYLNLAAVIWCRLMHSERAIMRERYTYRCGVCMRQYALPWAPEQDIPDGAWRRL